MIYLVAAHYFHSIVTNILEFYNTKRMYLDRKNTFRYNQYIPRECYEKRKSYGKKQISGNDCRKNSGCGASSVFGKGL